MIRCGVALVLVLLWSVPAWAEFLVCYDVARAPGSRFYYFASLDPSTRPDPNCHVVPDEQLQDARDLVVAPLRFAPPGRFLIVEQGRLREMSEPEKDAVQAYLDGREAVRQVWQTELERNPTCPLRNLQALERVLTEQEDAVLTKVEAITETDPASLKQHLGAIVTGLFAVLRQYERCHLARVWLPLRPR